MIFGKSKEEIRRGISAKRTAQTEEEIKEKSGKIKERLFQLEEFQNAETIMFYVALKGEVETRGMVEEAIASGKKVVVPVTDFKTNEMLASEIKSLDELKEKEFGLLEPKDEFVREVPLEEIDLVVVPGVAFDEKGNRLGRGLGFYDKFLSKIKTEAVFIALAFDFQVLKEIPCKEHDMKVDKIVTEERVINA